MASENYPELVQCYLDYHRLRTHNEQRGVIDLSGITFLYPSTLLPLRYYTHNTQPTPKLIQPNDPNVANYMELAKGSRAWTTGCPYVEITQKSKEVEKDLNNFFGKHFEHGEKCGGQNAFKTLIGELVDNVLEHSEFSKAYVEGQIYKKKGFTELCILDNGKSIPGSFKEHGKPFKNDVDAIIQAISGVTTKAGDERGTGLGFVSNLITKGLCGEAFISSGDGFVYLGKNGKDLVFNDPRIRYKGTIAALRMPYVAKKVDINDFINTRPNTARLLSAGT
ncbi:MAG: hypothetical protein NTX79_07110 [Candidatus Micrarchaeota archaeon]|nr:hypothetical protein [Candidatus Micrarchaeota archaeon]